MEDKRVEKLKTWWDRDKVPVILGRVNADLDDINAAMQLMFEDYSTIMSGDDLAIMNRDTVPKKLTSIEEGDLYKPMEKEATMQRKTAESILTIKKRSAALEADVKALILINKDHANSFIKKEAGKGLNKILLALGLLGTGGMLGSKTAPGSDSILRQLTNETGLTERNHLDKDRALYEDLMQQAKEEIEQKPYVRTFGQQDNVYIDEYGNRVDKEGNPRKENMQKFISENNELFRSANKLAYLSFKHPNAVIRKKAADGASELLKILAELGITDAETLKEELSPAEPAAPAVPPVETPTEGPAVPPQVSAEDFSIPETETEPVTPEIPAPAEPEITDSGENGVEIILNGILSIDKLLESNTLSPEEAADLTAQREALMQKLEQSGM